MNFKTLFSRVRQGSNQEGDGRQQTGNFGTSLWQGLSGRSLEMAEVQEEVAAEQQGRIAIIGRNSDVNQWLLSRLRQQACVLGDGQVCREGFFTLAHLPSPVESPHSDDGNWDWDCLRNEWAADDLVADLSDTDLMMYLFRQADGWQAADSQWYARLRATGTPLLPVLVARPSSEPPQDEPGALVDSLRLKLGTRPVLVWEGPEGQTEGATALPKDLATLVDRILTLRPRLAVPLAQEIPPVRDKIARRVIRTGVIMTSLLGAEPIPLLDLPLHVAFQWRVALQLAAIYGRPGLDCRSREMVGTIGVSLAARHIAQQGVKLVPWVGWLLSAGLSGLSTWMLGNGLRRYYEGGPIFSFFGLRKHGPEPPSTDSLDPGVVGADGAPPQSPDGSWAHRLRSALRAVTWARGNGRAMAFHAGSDQRERDAGG